MPNEIDRNKRYKITYTNFETGEHRTLIAKGSEIFSHRISESDSTAVEQGNIMSDYLGVIHELDAIAKKMWDLSYRSGVSILRPYALLIDDIGTILFREVN